MTEGSRALNYALHFLVLTGGVMWIIWFEVMETGVQPGFYTDYRLEAALLVIVGVLLVWIGIAIYERTSILLQKRKCRITNHPAIVFLHIERCEKSQLRMYKYSCRCGASVVRSYRALTLESVPYPAGCTRNYFDRVRISK